MNSLALLLPLLWFFAAPPLLTDEALRVVADDPALGEEIARAARRYVRGPIQVAVAKSAATPGEGNHASSPQGAEAGAEGATVLHVQRKRGSVTAEGWVLSLSAGHLRVVQRTLTLHEAATRFDLAEAVAIGLPDMLARLSEPAAHAPPGKPPVPVGSPPTVRPGLALLGATASPAVSRRPVSRALSSQATTPGLPRERDPSRRPPRDPVTPSASSSPPAPPAAVNPPPPADQDPQPQAAPEPAGPAASPASSPAPERPAPSERAAAPTPQPPPPRSPAPLLAPLLAPPLAPPPAPTPSPSRAPAGAIAVTISGAVVLFAGIVTGSAALLAARQVDSPIGGRFDPELDRRGRALDTATIVLDSVGGAALLAGGTWLIYHTVKTRRATPKIVALPGGAGVSWTGAF